MFYLVLKLGVTIARKMLPKCKCRMYYNQKVYFHCMYDLLSYTFSLHQLPRTIVSYILSYKKCTIKYKLGGHVCELATEYRTMFI